MLSLILVICNFFVEHPAAFRLLIMLLENLKLRASSNARTCPDGVNDISFCPPTNIVLGQEHSTLRNRAQRELFVLRD